MNLISQIKSVTNGLIPHIMSNPPVSWLGFTGTGKIISAGLGSTSGLTQGFSQLYVNTPPTVNFIAPIDGTTVTGQVQFNITATDNKKLSHLYVFIDGVKQLDQIGITSLSFKWNSAGYRGRSVLFTAQAVDAEGLATKVSITLRVR